MESSTLIKLANIAGTATLAQGGRCTLTAARFYISGSAADAYLQVFDAASASDVTVGTTTADWVVMLDSGTGDVSGGDGLPTSGLTFTRGIVVACTTTPSGNTGATAQVRLAVL